MPAKWRRSSHLFIGNLFFTVNLIICFIDVVVYVVSPDIPLSYKITVVIVESDWLA